ncbi:MAG: signal peptide peptidase SppA, partial [Hyphomonadaceae bacterium]|nr:signal peptide peptidase SppA [Hyphomonadaceae bacterium]
SASDEIWQQGATSFSVAGIHSEVGFYRGILDKIEAEPQIEQFHEYKSAANAYMETGFTDSHREATLSLLDSLYLTAVENIALDRGLTPSAVKTAFTDAPHTAEEASALGFVDEIGYYLDARDYARDKAGGGSVRFDSVHSYSVTPDFSAPVIAFVGGQGSVVNGESRDGSNPLSSSVTMGGDTVSQAINDAAMDESVKAILFRVSTPGGSATASDQIHDAVQRARDAGKPVIVSMGQYAASGGYYVSANADHIVALPGTITGSIGVLGGKIAFEDSYAMIGYNVEQLDVGGDFVSAFSVDVPFTESQRLAFRARLEDIYNGFVSRVAEGRNMSVNQVGKVAKGRVWTGVQALEHGLVDEQGGLMTAIAAARRLAGIDEDSGVRLKMFPRPKSATEQLEEILGSAVSARQDLDLLREVAALPEVRAVIDARAGLEPGQELLADIPDIE